MHRSTCSNPFGASVIPSWGRKKRSRGGVAESTRHISDVIVLVRLSSMLYTPRFISGLQPLRLLTVPALDTGTSAYDTLSVLTELQVSPDSRPPQPMRGNARAFGGCGELHPDDFFRHVFATSERAETAISSGDHPLPVTDHRHSLLDPSSDKFRMLDKIRGGVENAGHEQHVCRQRVSTQCVVFVLMPGIGELDRKCPDIGTVQRGQDGRHRDVMDMRSVTVAQQTWSRTRSRGMPSIPKLIATICSSSCRRNSASPRCEKNRFRSIARSGASICRTMPASWIARYSLDSAFARAVR